MKDAQQSMELFDWMKSDVPEVLDQEQDFGVDTESTKKQVVKQMVNKNITILCANTTLIGDYVATIFPEHSNKWLVQAMGNATFASILQLIKEDLVTVDRQYVFIQLGGNQIRMANYDLVFQSLVNLVVAVRERRPDSRIFVIGVLPRPIDNAEAKPYICRINRWIASAVEKIQKMFQKVKFIPLHLKFLDAAKPKLHLFQQDGLMLSAAGAQLFKKLAFEMAGFVANA